MYQLNLDNAMNNSGQTEQKYLQLGAERGKLLISVYSSLCLNMYVCDRHQRFQMYVVKLSLYQLLSARFLPGAVSAGLCA